MLQLILAYKWCQLIIVQYVWLAFSILGAWEKGVVLAEGQNLARYLMEMPANKMTPTKFSEVAKEKLGSLDKVDVRIRYDHSHCHRQINFTIGSLFLFFASSQLIWIGDAEVKKSFNRLVLKLLNTYPALGFQANQIKNHFIVNTNSVHRSHINMESIGVCKGQTKRD